MKPVDFAEANRTLKAPCATSTNVASLRAWTDGVHCISRWRPTWRDRLRVLFGAPIWLWVVSGETQPPVAVETESPWVSA
jgi:hypothetical protein